MAEGITQNSILRISDEKTMQLIELYKREECLWNTYSEDYKNREKRARATERIAKELDVKYFEPRHVIIKFKNLRNSYCQELKKIAQSLHSGLGEEEMYRPKVFWFSRMDSFLRSHLQPLRGSVQSNLIHNEDKVKKEPEDCEENEELVQLTSPEMVLLRDASDQYSDEEHLEDKNPKKRNRNLSRNHSKRLKIEDEELSQTLKNISAHLHVLTSERDSDYFDSFGKYIASMLRSMPPQKALNLQPKIVSLIASVGFGSNEGHVSQSDDL